MRVTWRKQPDEKGLAAVGQGPRGAILKVDGEDVARVYPLRQGLKFAWDGWYWAARGDHIPLRNTASESKYYKDIEEAKRDCLAYVVEKLSRATLTVEELEAIDKAHADRKSGPLTI